MDVCQLESTITSILPRQGDSHRLFSANPCGEIRKRLAALDSGPGQPRRDGLAIALCTLDRIDHEIGVCEEDWLMTSRENRSWLTLVGLLMGALVMLVLLASVSPPGLHAAVKRCGSQGHPGAGWYNVRAHNVSCREARHVARHYWHTGDKHFEGWSCHTHRVAEELSRARCHRQAPHRFQKVKFEFGS
jgi:hypothetical protein